MNALSRMNKQSGFTLLEVLIALVIFAVGILGVASMQISSIKGNSKGRQISEATNAGADRIEQLISLEYDDALLDDVDGDGTGQDTSTPPDGLDNSGGNFGLDDATDATADGSDDRDGDGTNDIFWNIAIDQPMAGFKTIRFIVDPLASGQSVVMTYVKRQPI